jgi:cardiolipin synthase (CMP-forming)
MKNSPLNFANLMTVLRILATPVLIGILIKHREAFNLDAPAATQAMYRYYALGVFAFAAATDAADGLIARFFNQKTDIGTVLDPIADKVLLTATILMLSFPIGFDTYRLPFWFPIIVLSRDFIILAGIAVIFMVRGNVPVVPTFTGKITTLFQVITVLSVLLYLPDVARIPIIVATTFLTCLSGLHYIYRGFVLVSSPHINPHHK